MSRPRGWVNPVAEARALEARIYNLITYVDRGRNHLSLAQFEAAHEQMRQVARSPYFGRTARGVRAEYYAGLQSVWFMYTQEKAEDVERQLRVLDQSRNTINQRVDRINLARFHRQTGQMTQEDQAILARDTPAYRQGLGQELRRIDAAREALPNIIVQLDREADAAHQQWESLTQRR